MLYSPRRKTITCLALFLQCTALFSCKYYLAPIPDGLDNSFVFYNFTHWVSDDGRLDFICASQTQGFGKALSNGEMKGATFYLRGLGVNKLNSQFQCLLSEGDVYSWPSFICTKEKVEGGGYSALSLTVSDNHLDDSSWDEGTTTIIRATRAKEDELDARYFYGFKFLGLEGEIRFFVRGREDLLHDWVLDFHEKQYVLTFGDNRTFSLSAEGEATFRGTYSPTYYDMTLRFETANPFDGKDELLLTYSVSNGEINLFPDGD